MTIQFVMTIAGTIPLLAFFIIQRIYGELLEAKVYVRILRLSVLLYLIPFQKIKFLFPSRLVQIHDKGLVIRDFVLDKTEFQYLKLFLEDETYQIPKLSAFTLFICAVIFLMLMGIRIWNYTYVRRMLRYNADELEWEEQSLIGFPSRMKKVRLYESMEIATPCMTGIFHPYIIIPEELYDERQKGWIIRHEMGHILHHDMFWKILCMMCCAFHWYNIFAYLLLYEYSCHSENYCDEFVMAERSKDEKKEYGIFIVEQSKVDADLFHSFQGLTDGGKNMRKRMSWLLSEKKRRGVIASLVVAGALFMSSSTVFAYSSYKEADIPMESGDYIIGMQGEDDENYVVAMDEVGENQVDDMESIDFHGANKVFREEGSSEFIVLDDKEYSGYLLCTHSWRHGYVYVHHDIDGPGCQVLQYEGDVCRKCQSERNMEYIGTMTYAKCTHKK